MNASFDFKPIVILGAGRSGTNALRDVLTSLPEFATWDCDEINPIWRHGNISWPNDAFPETLARPEVRAYIRSTFVKIWKAQGRPAFVVEKTCANTLRVPFVDAVLPEAVFIHIVRRGDDVVASASKRWQGKMELPKLPYFLSKARYTPLRDLPNYALSFARSRMAKLLGRQERLASWGPRFDGMDDMADASLEDLCARQWAECVSQADAALDTLPQARVIEVRYEDFVQHASGTIAHILERLGTSATPEAIDRATASIRADSIGKGGTLSARLRPDVRAMMADVSKRHNYRE